MIFGEFAGLRAVEEEDLSQLLTWRNNSELRKYFREYRILNMEQQREWFIQKVLNDANTIMFSIVDINDENSLIGCCGLCYIDWINRNADFSIYIGKDLSYIDQKCGPDAADLLIDYGFGELNLHRIYAEIFEFDEPKRVLLKNLGFKYEGKSHDKLWFEGKWVDSENYAILSED